MLSALLAASAITTSAPAEDRYADVPKTRDGIGKAYLGREIAHVMGHRGAAWLERPSRDREEHTSELVALLPVEPDHVIADVGAGTGFFSFALAERVPEGEVLAVDVQPEMIAIIEERKRQRGVSNVRTRLGTPSDPRLAPGSIDLILLVDAYHEFEYPNEMGEAMAEALSPGGLLVLVEYRAEDPEVPIKPLHKMSEQQARREMAVIGLEWVRTDASLPRQHVMFFRRPIAPAGG